MDSSQASTSKPPNTPLEELNAEAAKKIYSPLRDGEIRIIKLHEAPRRDEPIRCTLVTAQLAAAPKYFALSYVWGSIADPKTIFVDSQPFKVTQSLEAALKQVRSADDDRLFWVDALVINQCDVLERNIQVQMMRNIYSTAELTIASLGQGVDDDIISALFMLLAEMAIPDEQRGDMPLPPSDLLKFSVFAMAQLADIPYWQRVWVVQEVMYSKDVLLQYGANFTPMDSFCAFWDTICNLVPSVIDPQNIENDGIKYANAIGKVRNMFLRTLRPDNARGGSPLNYFTWAWEFCMKRECYDPRDKIFGFYGCFPQEVQQKIVIDYRQPIEELYTEVTRVWMEFACDLKSLDTADIYSRKMTPGSGLPSWAMNYTIGPRPARLLFKPLQVPFDRPKSFYFSSDSRILHAKGFRIGTVTKCSETVEFDGGDIGDGSALHARLIEHSEHCKDALGFKHEADLDTFSLAFGGSHLGLDRLDELKSFMNLQQQQQGHHSGRDISDTLLLLTAHQARLMFTMTLYSPLLDPSRSFRGAVSVFGLGPCEMAPGDEVFFIHGSAWALVFRKIGEHYIRLGSAFTPNLEKYWETFVQTKICRLTDISIC